MNRPVRQERPLQPLAAFAMVPYRSNPRRQIGHGPIRGSLPYDSWTGPSVTVVSVSVTVSVMLRSEEHTSELQSRLHLVCRLLLEKKKQIKRLSNPSRHKQALTHCARCDQSW